MLSNFNKLHGQDPIALPGVRPRRDWWTASASAYGQDPIALPGVRQTRTFFVMKQVKDNAPLVF